jgi:hypothetical protein
MLHVEQWDFRSRIEMTGAGPPWGREGVDEAGLAGAFRGFFACSFIGVSLVLEAPKLIWIKQRESKGKSAP